MTPERPRCACASSSLPVSRSIPLRPSSRVGRPGERRGRRPRAHVGLLHSPGRQCRNCGYARCCGCQRNPPMSGAFGGRTPSQRCDHRSRDAAGMTSSVRASQDFQQWATSDSLRYRDPSAAATVPVGCGVSTTEPTPPRPVCQGRAPSDQSRAGELGQSSAFCGSNVNGRRIRSMEFCRRSAHNRKSCRPRAHRVGQIVLFAGHRLHRRAGELGLDHQFLSEIAGVRIGNRRHLIAEPGELQDREGPADGRRQATDDGAAVLPGRGQHQVCSRDQRRAQLNRLVLRRPPAGVRRARSPRRGAAASDPECSCRPSRPASRPGRRNARGRRGQAVAGQSGSGSDLRCRRPGPGKSPLPAPHLARAYWRQTTPSQATAVPGVGTAGPAGADFTSPDHPASRHSSRGATSTRAVGGRCRFG